MSLFLRRDDTHDSNKLDPGWITTTGEAGDSRML